MSAIGALITVGTVGAVVGLGAAALNSAIAQDAYKQGEADLNRANRKATNTVTEGVAASQAALDPYAQAGVDALQMQRDLDGLNGPAAQQRAIQMIQSSPALQAAVQAQEQGILANASATGGLRGGDTQRALAEGRSTLLANAIQQQYGQYASLAQAGQQAATNQAGFGMQGAGSIADLQNQRGQIAAGTRIGIAGAQMEGVNNVANVIPGMLGSVSGVV